MMFLNLWEKNQSKNENKTIKIKNKKKENDNKKVSNKLDRL